MVKVTHLVAKFIFLAVSLELMKQQVHCVNGERWQSFCEIIFESEYFTAVAKESADVIDSQVCCFVKSSVLNVQVKQLWKKIKMSNITYVLHFDAYLMVCNVCRLRLAIEERRLDLPECT